MHAEAHRAMRDLLADIPTDGARVLELGAYNVNGSARDLLPGARITGLDVRPGPGVDIVADAATYAAPEPYDLIISTEMLEHCADPAGVLAMAWRNLRPGGWLVLTAAGPERAPHACDGGPVVPPGEPYANIHPADLMIWLDGWAEARVIADATVGDVYARARRPEEAPAP